MGDLWRGTGRLTWRRFGVLVDGLPMDSRTSTHIRDRVPLVVKVGEKKPEPEFGPWSHADYQRADTNDLLRQVIQAIIASTGTRPGNYQPVDRPSRKVHEDDTAWRELLAAERAEHEARRRAAGLEV